MQAIQTKYLGPTNSHGGRILAKCAAGRLIVHWDHALDFTANHEAAARKLAEKLGWLMKGWSLKSGSLPDDSYVHVLVYRKR